MVPFLYFHNFFSANFYPTKRFNFFQAHKIRPFSVSFIGWRVFILFSKPYYNNFAMEADESNQNERQIQPGRVFLKYQSAEVEGECIIMQISPIKFISWRYGIFLVSNIFLCLPYLFTFWYPEYKRKFYYDFCSLEEGTDFYILNYDHQVSIVSKQKKVFMIDEEKSAYYTFFVNRYMTYILDQNEVVRVSMYDYRDRISHIVRSSKEERGLSDCQAHELKNSYGPGTMVVERPSCVDLCIRQILRPLYLFLIFSVSYWTWDEKYFYFAGVLFFITAFGLTINLYQMIQLNNKIFSMAYYDIPVNVLREGKIQITSSIDVVPGDIVFLKDPIKIPFEGIILQGSALINECALTGESVPIVKKADSFERMGNASMPIDKTAFVFQGTTIIQVNDKKKMSKFESFRERYGIPVCVVRTNFVTTKGQLIRIILFPKEQQNIFQKESYKYLAFLFILAVSTYVVIIILVHNYLTWEDIVQKFFDLITITVPPALPVSMTFGIIYAVERLEQKGIYCIAQNKVITGGMIEFSCFDKTGTLTEDFMDFYALVPANQCKFYPAIQNNEPNINKMLENCQKTPFLNTILTNMAANNSIIKIQATNELIGDPMEVKIFQFGRFQLNQSHTDPNVIFGFQSERGHQGVVFRRFQFDADLQRMSVICRNSITKGCEVYAKGSPEMMLTIMKSSTVPSNYQEILKQYASHGFRVLSIASKSVPQGAMQTITRAQAEKDLEFNGFQVFQNKLKPQTRGAIAILKGAQIGCVMITGDNTLTGSNISYKCDISDRSKGMIICDYDNAQFVEDRFFFEEDDNSTEVSYKNNTPMPDVALPNTKEANEEGLAIELKIRDKIDSNQRLNKEDSGILTQGKIFMEAITHKAKLLNCQLCVTGRAFNQLFPGLITDLTLAEKAFMNSVSVFARTKPNDKAKIVMAYQHMDKKVSMCGDGANDCGALKQADIGLSLSQAEASISAPFTSRIGNISSMVQLIKECRGGLATNFSLFNILAIYSLVEYTTTVISLYFLQYPADLHYLYWDLCLNFFFILFIGYTKTAKDLSVDRPRSSLFGITNLLQMIIAFGIQVAGQMSIIAIFKAYNSDYYWANGGIDVDKANYDQNGFSAGLQSCVVFVFVNNIYVITMITFNIAKPWREYFFTNIPLMVVIIGTLFYNQVLLLWPEASWNELQAADYLYNYDIRWIVFGASWGFALVIWALQKLVLEPLSNKLVNQHPEIKWL